MPVNITKPNGITESHTAERLEIILSLANEDVTKMKIRVFFNIDTFLNGEKISKTSWDNEPLEFDCTDDPALESAMLIIQERIGQRRYENLSS